MSGIPPTISVIKPRPTEIAAPTVGAHTAKDGGAGTVTTNAVTTQVSGSTFCIICPYRNGDAAPTASDSFSNSVGTPTIVSSNGTYGTDSPKLAIWIYQGTGGSGHTASVTTAAGVTTVFFCELIPASGLAVALDKSASSAANTSPYSSGATSTTTSANELILGFIGDGYPNDPTDNVQTPADGSTVVNQIGDFNSFRTGALSQRTVSAVGTYASSWTLNYSPADCAVWVGAFKSA